MSRPTSRVLSATGCAVLLLAAMRSEPAGTHAALVLPVKPDVPAGYPDKPGTRIPALRQDLTEIVLQAKDDGRYALRLGPAEDGPLLAELDLRSFVPRIPELARGDVTLTRLALSQREFNRNETRYRNASNTAELRLANNCLRQGLWEVLSAQRQGQELVEEFHGWFTFPADVYARLFTQVNGTDLAQYEDWLAKYPKLNGVRVPLPRLRSVQSERVLAVAIVGADQAPPCFGEQRRKQRLVLSPDVVTLAGFSAPDEQPVSTARFEEPGLYGTDNPVRFDLAWLAAPARATWRSVHGVSQDVALDELEIAFADGKRIVLADESLATLPPRSEPPASDSDTLRLTFGIGTPEIYMSGDERAAEFAAPRANYLLLLDADGRNLDNHDTGIDRVFLWREAGEPERLHILLVAYERIAIVSHLAVDWAPATRD